ncbi:TatD family hydrolase, partial [Lysobacter sp. 2RAB21]
TYDRAQRLRRIVAAMPIEFLLLETDAPDQPDAQIRGQRNEPARLSWVCEVVAGLRGVAVEEIAAATSDNARRLFQLP